MRHVNFLARLELNLADSQDVLRPLVEQRDDLRVQLIDGLAMFRDVHLGIASKSKGQMPNKFGRGDGGRMFNDLKRKSFAAQEAASRATSWSHATSSPHPQPARSPLPLPLVPSPVVPAAQSQGRDRP